jgi:hypothetical protein
MAKITVDGTVYEGTAEELKEIFAMMGVEFPAGKAKEEPFKVGDKVRLTSGGNKHPLLGLVTGKIYEVFEPKPKYHVGTIQIKGGGFSGFAKPDQLEKVSAEEVAEIEAKAKKESERFEVLRRWAKIGRKPNEFKEGDIVKFVTHAFLIESISDTHIYFKTHGGSSYGVYIGNVPSTVELITPVEARFDRA